MRRFFCVALLFLAGPGAAATIGVPTGTYALDPTHTSVTWKVGHLGLSNYTARFARVSGSAMVDDASPAKSSVSISIDTNSVRTDYPYPDKEDFDKKLGSDEHFLDGGKFPAITFVSRSITLTGPDTAKISGDLTLRGVTRAVVLDTKLNGALKQHPVLKIPMFGISATTSIKRQDYGITLAPGIIGDTVTIIIESEFRGPAPK